MTRPTDDLTTLASAYLDGEVTSDERARVEADADLLAEVERLRQVRALAGDVDPAPISVRERHLAGALDVFDRLGAERRDATPADRVAVPLATRRRTAGASRWLLGAAASLVVVAAGAAVFRAVGNESGGDDDLAETAAISDADDAATLGDDPADAIPEMAAEEFTGEREDAPLPLPEGAEAESDGLSGDATASIAAEEPAEAAAADEATDGGAEPPADAQFEGRPEVDLVDLGTPTDLADFAALALDAPASPTPVDPSLDICRTEFSIDLVVGPALYQGTEVVVGIDLDTDSVYAYDADCNRIGSAILR